MVPSSLLWKMSMIIPGTIMATIAVANNKCGQCPFLTKVKIMRRVMVIAETSRIMAAAE
ncbi:hypothetical protein D3C80_1925670 [compost metagenome]